MKKYRAIKTTVLLLICVVSSILVTAQHKGRTVFDDVEFKVEPLGIINTNVSEISPAFINNSIFFTGIPEEYLDKSEKKKNTAFYSVFSAAIDSNGLVTSRRRLVYGFGFDIHEGPVDYCKKTGELFVTMSSDYESNSTNQNNLRKKNIRLRLVIMKFFDGRWQVVKKLPFNDPRFHFAHPAISITGDTLVFSSDYNTVNYGNSDLFMSVRTNDEWSAPINLGNEINTVGNELFPTFIKGGLLSFASNGRTENKGGLDIYYTTFPDSSEIKTLGNNINTEFDDFGLVIYKNEKIGYFASNRNMDRSDDIFKLEINKLFEIVEGKVVNHWTNQPVQNVNININNCDGNFIKKTFTDSLGNFYFEVPNKDCLQINASKEGYKVESKKISDANYIEFSLKQDQYYEIVALDPNNLTPVDGVTILCDTSTLVTNDEGLVTFELPLPDECELKIKKEGYLNLRLKVDAFFEKVVTKDTVYLYKKERNKTYLLSSNYSKWSIVNDLEEEWNKLIIIMNDNPDIKVEIGFHTDSRGGDAYNEWLSQKHADIARNYIIENGIGEKRIVAKGYGESQLINRCANGVDCTEEEHAQNRRIEFKITEINPM